MSVEQSMRARLIRVLGFYKKEMLSVFRQPRLLLTLVIGPFLILLVFGIGYRNQPAPFRTVLAIGSEEAQLAADVDDLSEAFGSSIDLQGTTTDPEAAEQRLRDGEIDLLIIAPEDPLADFTVMHGEVDPVLRASIGLIARLSVDEINRRVVANVIQAAQSESEDVEDPIEALRVSSSRLVDALEAGNQTEADNEIQALRQDLAVAERQTQQSDSLYESIAEAFGSESTETIGAMREKVDAAESGTPEERLQSAREMEETLTELEAQIARAQQLDPDVLASPFRADIVTINDVSTEPGIFYAPGTLALLVQHLALTFAALSLVRERQLGLTEIFRVSPLASGEAVIGKYLGFATISGAVAAALTLAMTLFSVQIRGSIWIYVLVIALLIFASLGLGFLISGISQTDSQAVQYSMIALLISIFFSGFVLPLDQLRAAVQTVSYLIPATYGVQALQDVVFRGVQPSVWILGGLGAYAVVMAIAAWVAVRRDVVSVR